MNAALDLIRWLRRVYGVGWREDMDDQIANMIHTRASDIAGRFKTNEWQPIDSVPSGHTVLLWFPNGEKGVGGMEAAMVFPEHGSPITSGWTHGGPNSGSDFEFCEPPTKWTPLPPPPSPGSRRC